MSSSLALVIDFLDYFPTVNGTNVYKTKLGCQYTNTSRYSEDVGVLNSITPWNSKDYIIANRETAFHIGAE